MTTLKQGDLIKDIRVSGGRQSGRTYFTKKFLQTAELGKAALLEIRRKLGK